MMPAIPEWLQWVLIFSGMIAFNAATSWAINKLATRKRATIGRIRSAHEVLIDGLENAEDINSCLVVWTERENPNHVHLHSNTNVEQFIDGLAQMRASGRLRVK